MCNPAPLPVHLWTCYMPVVLSPHATPLNTPPQVPPHFVSHVNEPQWPSNTLCHAHMHSINCLHVPQGHICSFALEVLLIKVLDKKSNMCEGGPKSEGGGDLTQQIKFLPPNLCNICSKCTIRLYNMYSMITKYTLEHELCPSVLYPYYNTDTYSTSLL